MNMNIGSTVREITDDEVAFYDEHGWVKLDQLISKDAAAALLKASEALMAEAEDRLESANCAAKPHPWGTMRELHTPEGLILFFDHPGGAKTHELIAVQVDPFLSLNQDKRMGRAAHRLINRSGWTDDEIGVRYASDSIFCRTSGKRDATNGTTYHQDGPDFCSDRMGIINIWIALGEVTPDHGTMRFMDGSHRAGPLGHRGGETDLLKRYPKLEKRYPLTPPMQYQPGDATAHHQMMVHGASGNVTGQPRWAYTCVYMAEDCVIDPSAPFGMPEPKERHPLVYP